MPNYRRRRRPGGTFFFTLHLADENACTLAMEIDTLRRIYAEVGREHPFKTDTIVILPNHLHAIWTLPQGDSDYSTRWRCIKGRFTHALRDQERRRQCDPDLSTRKVWQSRFWEHEIRNAQDLAFHRHYCWADPVRHRLVHDPNDWAFSSFHRRGIRPPNPSDLVQPKKPLRMGELYETPAPVQRPRRSRETAA